MNSSIARLNNRTKILREKVRSGARKKAIQEKIKILPPSYKQLMVYSWWKHPKYKDLDGIISDGSIRSGKTMSTSFSFVIWAMETFNQQNLAICGKTVGSVKRNIIKDLRKLCRVKGYKTTYRGTDNLLIVSRGDIKNYFYVFGGDNQRSASLIQGITLGGIYLDEVVLMPQSFVDQAMSRCSVEGSKFWFTCNPASPYHWFKTEFVDMAKEKEFLYLHFTMDDNPSLSEKKKKQYKRLYTGVFYKRYILGLWVQAEGLIYSMFDEEIHKIEKFPTPGQSDKIFLTIDYGKNQTVVLLVVRKNGVYYVIDEFAHSGLKTNVVLTDHKLMLKMEELMDKNNVKEQKGIYIIVDTNAVSFKQTLKENGYMNVKNPKKDVIDGIMTVTNYLGGNRLYIASRCKETLKEFFSYSWNEKKASVGIDEPIKEHDHSMDCIRMLLHTLNQPLFGIQGPADRIEHTKQEVVSTDVIVEGKVYQGKYENIV